MVPYVILQALISNTPYWISAWWHESTLCVYARNSREQRLPFCIFAERYPVAQEGQCAEVKNDSPYGEAGNGH